MHHFFINSDQINEKKITVLGNDVRHIKSVLRMKVSDEISFSDGEKPVEYHGIITEITDRHIICDLIYIQKSNHELPARVYLFQALPKADKMELIIQKAVELGIYEIIPIFSDRSVIRLDEKKAQAKIKRWQGISEASAKQCKRQVIPRISDIMSFKEAVKYAADKDIKIIPYEMAEDMNKTKTIFSNLKTAQSVAVFIGSEGGFTNQEIELAKTAGISPITMGKRILRTETAGFVILSWIMYQLEE
ncbi:MAG: 16S rRNA (uracil(1498)-N(3))-methyltransferase [Lachnospiraceae bacterium]|nr:16S rRNA (uracil(1498)-N(3))-methyltransferase [Lachnospiraceae bacterium]